MPSILLLSISKLERKQERHPLSKSANVTEGRGQCAVFFGGVAAVLDEI